MQSAKISGTMHRDAENYFLCVNSFSSAQVDLFGFRPKARSALKNSKLLDCIVFGPLTARMGDFVVK